MRSLTQMLHRNWRTCPRSVPGHVRPPSDRRLSLYHGSLLTQIQPLDGRVWHWRLSASKGHAPFWHIIAQLSCAFSICALLPYHPDGRGQTWPAREKRVPIWRAAKLCSKAGRYGEQANDPAAPTYAATTLQATGAPSPAATKHQVRGRP